MNHCCWFLQIYDLESNYFGVSSAMGNAIRGYEGFLGASKKVAPAVQPEERLFSWSRWVPPPLLLRMLRVLSAAA